MKLTTKITPHHFNPKSLESNIVVKHTTHTCYQDYMSSEKNVFDPYHVNNNKKNLVNH